MAEAKTYNQAYKSPSWTNAMQTKLSALASINTWSIVTLPPNKKQIGCKWVYKIKYNADMRCRIISKQYKQDKR